MKTIRLRSLVRAARRARQRRRRPPGRSVEWLETRSLLAVFLVSNTADGGPGSLRQALLDANASPNDPVDLDRIAFAIEGAGVQTIRPDTPLPAIVEAVLVDGWSQGGEGYRGLPLVELDGQNELGTGLEIIGSRVQVRGLAIHRFNPGSGTNAAIWIHGPGATDNWIYGNLLGTDASGVVALGNRRGLLIQEGADRNTIGTDGNGVEDATEANVISGNEWRGVVLSTAGNVVAGNRIGTDVTGQFALPNLIGIQVFGSAGNRIGTNGDGVEDAAERNVISGNAADGILLVNGATGNIVAGNLIGTDATGLAPLPNGGNGIYAFASTANAIGGTAAGAGNVISGNALAGVVIEQGGGNVVQGNLIGVGSDGASAVGNGGAGIHLLNASDNTIGGATPGARNVISANNPGGIGWIGGITVAGTGADRNLIAGNYIGTDATGTIALENQDGVVLDLGPSHNTIGGPSSADGNVISGNRWSGVAFRSAGSGNLVVSNRLGLGVDGSAIGNLTGLYAESTAEILVGEPGSGNVISGNRGAGVFFLNVNASVLRSNRIGTDPDGLTARPNYAAGIHLENSPDNTIGGASAELGNLISGNNPDGLGWVGGITLAGWDSARNIVIGNTIGTDVSRSQVVSNFDGIAVVNGAWENTIGGETGGEGNLISGNRASGVAFRSAGWGNVVLGNTIGSMQEWEWHLGNYFGIYHVDTSGTEIGRRWAGNAVVGNRWDGVAMFSSSATTVTGNRIARNAASGLYANSSSGVSITGNWIGTDATGSLPEGNTYFGILLDQSPYNTIGGTGSVDGNVISANGGQGVAIYGPGSQFNRVQGNRIGASGMADEVLPNNNAAVEIAWGASDNLIGGTEPGAGNVVMGRFYDPGVAVKGDDTVRNAILGNRILGTGTAIDLGGDGTNDHGTTAPPGPNNRQPFPLLGPIRDGHLPGALLAAPWTTYRIEIYAGRADLYYGQPEANRLLDAFEVTTDGEGQALFERSITTLAGLPLIGATATDPWGNTSELSKPPYPLTISTPGSQALPSRGAPLEFSAATARTIALTQFIQAPVPAVPATLQLLVDTGTLTLAGTWGLSGSGDGTAGLAYTGFPADLNAALDGLRFVPDPAFTGTATLTLRLDSAIYGLIETSLAIEVPDRLAPVFDLPSSFDTFEDTDPVLVPIGSLWSPTGDLSNLEFEVSAPSEFFAGATVEWDGSSPTAWLRLTLKPDAWSWWRQAVTVTARTPDPALPGAHLTFSRSTDVEIRPSNDSPYFDPLPDLTLFDWETPNLVPSGILLGPPDEPQDYYGLGVSLDRYDLMSAEIDYSTLPRRVQLRPYPGATGAVTVTVTLYDYSDYSQVTSFSRSFVVTIADGNAPPTFDPLADLDLPGPARVLPDLRVLNITPGRFDALGQPLTIRATSSNPALAGISSITLGTDGASARLRLARGPISHGTADITLTLVDSEGAESSQTFRVTVRPWLADETRIESEPNDSLAEAVPIAATDLDRPGLDHRGTLGPGDVDLYRIDVAFAGRFSASVDAAGRPVRIALLDASGRLLVQSDATSQDAPGGSIVQHLVPGAVFVRIEGNGPAAPGAEYTLSLVFEPGPAPLQDGVSAAFIDVNGDGRLDRVSVAPDPSSPAWYPWEVARWRVLTALNLGDGSFGEPTFLVLDSNLFGIVPVAGDYNGDGFVDVALRSNAFYGAPLLTILTGTGGGGFSHWSRTALSGSPSSMISADLNGDGVPDLLGAGLYGDAIVLVNQGDGTFGPEAHYALPNGLLTGDLDGDGRLDLMAGDYSSALRNRGDGTFEPFVLASDPHTYPVGGTALFDPDGVGRRNVAVRWFDIEGDGDLDRVEIYGIPYESGSYLRISRRAGATLSVTTTPLGATLAGYQSLVVADADGDGLMDVIASGSHSYLLRNHGDGTFEAPLQIARYLAAEGVGDVNGDGLADVLAFRWLPGRGDGSFLQSGEEGLDQQAIVWTDLNGDGIRDIVTSEPSVSLGRPDGSFATPVLYGGGNTERVVLAADFNADGRPDIATWDPAHTSIRVLLGRGDGTFFPGVLTPATGGSIPAIATIQADEDGLPDLLFVWNSGFVGVTLMRGRGDGSFDSPEVIAAPDWTDSYWVGTPLVVADLNSDQIEDFVFGSGHLFTGRGDGTFDGPDWITANGSLSSGNPIITDSNGDGIVDVVVGASPGGGTTYVILGTGNGVFAAPRLLAQSSYHTFTRAANLDGDDWTDLVGIFYTQITIAHSLGNGSYATSQFETGHTIRDLQVADWNGDGLSDLLTTYEVHAGLFGLELLINQGDGTFASADESSSGRRTAPIVADVDGDGISDVTVVDYQGRVLWRRGRPDSLGQFDPPIVVNPGAAALDATVLSTAAGPRLAVTDSLNSQIVLYAWKAGHFEVVDRIWAEGTLTRRVAAADIDGDGDEDLVLLNTGSNSLTILENRTPLGFHPRQVVRVETGMSDLVLADANRDGKVDVLLSNAESGDVWIWANDPTGVLRSAGRYRAGTMPASVRVGASTGGFEVTSPDQTIGLAFGRADGGIYAINRGVGTLGRIAGLEDGRFANVATTPLRSEPLAIATGDLDRDGRTDAVILGDGEIIVVRGSAGASAVSSRFAAHGTEMGVELNDVDSDGYLDLLIASAFGDVRLLIGLGDGTFRPFQVLDPQVAIAVADLDRDGRTDFIFANEALERVSVQYGGSGTADVVGDRSTGLLAPGAVQVADLDGDGQLDLVVANSGANAILVYGGSGPGTFHAPRVFPVGTNPTGFTIADVSGDGRPDLVVANTGSNDVSVLVSQGNGSSWTLVAGPRLATAAGPVSVAAQDVDSDGRADLVVSSQLANAVQVIPGVGGGFFNDAAARPIAVGSRPGPVYVGNFDAKPGLDAVTLNGGSNDLSLISGIGLGNSPALNLPTGGILPVAGFARDLDGNGLTDLVVAHGGDGRYSLLFAGPDGPSLVASRSFTDVPRPSALALASVSEGAVSFYTTSAGREAAVQLALSWDAGPTASLAGSTLAFGPPTLGQVLTSPALAALPGLGTELADRLLGSLPGRQEIATLSPLEDSALALVATLLSATITLPATDAGTPSNLAAEGNGASGQAQPGEEDEASDVSTEEPEDPAGARSAERTTDEEASDEPTPGEEDGGVPEALEWAPRWERFVLGIEEGLEQARSTLRDVLTAPRLEGAEPAAAAERTDSALEEWAGPGTAPSAVDRIDPELARDITRARSSRAPALENPAGEPDSTDPAANPAIPPTARRSAAVLSLLTGLVVAVERRARARRRARRPGLVQRPENLKGAGN